jgi:molybdopterin-containing oxidoreductase family iron-sulfur binding subunit
MSANENRKNACTGESCMQSRRRFLLGAGATLLAPGVLLTARAALADEAGRQRWGLLIDTRKCVGDCSACVNACAATNGLTVNGRPATDAQGIR